MILKQFDASQNWVGSNVSFYHKRMQAAELHMTQVRMEQRIHHPRRKKYINRMSLFSN